MHIERMTKLAELMEGLAQRQAAAQAKLEPVFDMSSWAEVDAWDDEGNICGTSACACGHAALDPWFSGQGFHLLARLYDEDDEDRKLEEKVLYNLDDFLALVKEKRTSSFTMRYKDYGGFQAAEEFFGLSEGTAGILFGGRLHTPTQVAEAIRGLLADENYFDKIYPTESDYVSDDDETMEGEAP
jgi:hypothetical protein